MRKMPPNWGILVPETHPDFHWEEFEASQMAARRGLTNRVPDKFESTASRTLKVLQGIRNHLNAFRTPPTNHPLIITSGFRSPEVNLLVGGARNSDHLVGGAADFIMPSIVDPLDICLLLQPNMNELGIWQLIHEFGRWVHISTIPTALPGNRVLTIDQKGTRRGLYGAR